MRSAASTPPNTIVCSAGNLAVTCPYEPSWSRAVYHLYVMRTGDRDGMMAHLKAAGIGTGIHYPVPLHLQQAYATFGYKPWDFPAAERAAAEIVSLPMFPQLTAEQQLRVAKEIGQFVSSPHRAHPESEMDLTGSAAQIA